MVAQSERRPKKSGGSPANRSRRTVAPNLAKLSGVPNPAPIPALTRGNTDQVAPSLGSQPTLLRKTDAIEESTRPKQQERAQEVLASRKPAVQPYPTLPSTPAQKNAKNSESGRQPPPKVTWQQGHTRSPWRLNQTGRTLLNPQTVTPQPSVEELRRRVNPQEEGCHSCSA